jgi:hypothetical protein
MPQEYFTVKENWLLRVNTGMMMHAFTQLLFLICKYQIGQFSKLLQECTAF